MESRFGHDFSRVRVHTDAHAADSARALHAAAYSTNNHIAFGEGRYEPDTREGIRLLAHELTHVVQQSRSGCASADAQTFAEAEARTNGLRVAAGDSPSVIGSAVAGAIQCDGESQRPLDPRNTLDATAQAIIAAASNDSVAEAERAVNLVKSIINAYYNADISKVSVVFDDPIAGTGLHTDQKFGQGSKAETSTGVISVGTKFLAGVKVDFARRVLQVGHEIEHVGQWRGGMGGGQNKPEREFLAFQHESLGVEKPGTGRVHHATRVALIDAAIGNYYCMNQDKQQQYVSAKAELLARRDADVKASNQTNLGPAPTACRASA